jgi:hypothetical protein
MSLKVGDVAMPVALTCRTSGHDINSTTRPELDREVARLGRCSCSRQDMQVVAAAAQLLPDAAENISSAVLMTLGVKQLRASCREHAATPSSNHA